jgi:hypothetical protein
MASSHKCSFKVEEVDLSQVEPYISPRLQLHYGLAFFTNSLLCRELCYLLNKLCAWFTLKKKKRKRKLDLRYVILLMKNWYTFFHYLPTFVLFCFVHIVFYFSFFHILVFGNFQMYKKLEQINEHLCILHLHSLAIHIFVTGFL